MTDASAPPTPVGPRLVEGSGNDVVLVEGDHHRYVNPGPVRAALERILGPPVRGGDEELAGSIGDELAIESVTTGLEGLVELVPHSFLVSPPLGSTTLLGRTVHELTKLAAPPPAGLPALEQLRLARARGATHFIVVDAGAPWLELRPEVAASLARCARIVACSDVGAAWELQPPPAVGEPKIICIGLLKTATSSLHAALGQVGLRSLHSGDIDAYPVEGTAGLAAARAVRDALRDDRRLLAYVGEQYDAYSDITELSGRFELADCQYPGSKFILTVRDIEDWIDSRRRHVERNQSRAKRGFYQGKNLTIAEDAWRTEYEVFTQRVTDYFAGRDDLLVLDICGGDGWERLGPFLGLSEPPTDPFPSENVKDRALNRARPYLAARPGTATAALVERGRYREVTALRTLAALEAVLGRPVAVARGLLDELDVSPWPDIVVAEGGLLELARVAPRRSRVMVAGPTGCTADIGGRRVTRLLRGRGLPPPLPQLREAGATHLIVLTSEVRWVPNQADLAEHLSDQGQIVACNDAGVMWRLPREKRRRGRRRHRPGQSAQS